MRNVRGLGGHQGFPGVAFGGERADAGTAARGTGGSVWPEYGEASKAAIELAWTRPGAVRIARGRGRRGKARGLRRYQCKGCGRTFNALTGTPLSGLHKERWLSFALAEGETVKASASAAMWPSWRHRFLAAARHRSGVLKGIVEADETYVLESRKGARKLGRKARRGAARQRGLSREQVPVLMARTGAGRRSARC